MLAYMSHTLLLSRTKQKGYQNAIINDY